MHAYVYKSLRKPDTYLYLRDKDAFDQVPEPIRAPLGKLAFVLALHLAEGRKLARVDIGVVRSNLNDVGFYLQCPEITLDPLVSGGVGDG
jgi:uncharacterized protein YcgL (UPF0745 family)